MRLLATCLAAVALLTAVAAHALPDAGAASAGTWTTAEFQSHCPHNIDRLVSANEVVGVWYLQEIVKDGNYSSIPCIRTNFTAEGENIRAISHIDGENEPPRDDTFPHTEDGLWEDHVSPVRGKILLGLTTDGHLVWCGKNASQPLVNGSVLWARTHAPTITEGTLKTEFQSNRWIASCRNMADSTHSASTNETE